MSKKTGIFYLIILITGFGSYLFLSNHAFPGTYVIDKTMLNQMVIETNLQQKDEGKPPVEIQDLPVHESFMVYADLDYGNHQPDFNNILAELESIYEPAEGSGKTFSIREANANITHDNKLHISVSMESEKCGSGKLIYRKTGEVLWEGKIAGKLNNNITAAADKKAEKNVQIKPVNNMEKSVAGNSESLVVSTLDK